MRMIMGKVMVMMTVTVDLAKKKMMMKIIIMFSINLTIPSQVPQPLLLVVGWVYNTPKTVKFFFDTFHSFHLVTHWKKVIEIG